MNEQQNRCAAAADFCAARSAQQPLPVQTLVLDLDGMTAALCSCSPTGEIRQTHTAEAAGEADFFETLSRRAGLDADACRALCREQAPQAKKRYQRILRGADAETPLLTLPTGESLSWSDCRELLSSSLQRLESLLAETDRMLDLAGADRENLRILPVGSLAGFYPAEAALRIHFGGSALMADRRFPDPRPDLGPEDLVGRGQALYAAGSVEERSTFGHDVALLLKASVGGHLESVSIPLASADMESDALLAGGEPSPSFYAGENGAVSVLTDGQTQILSLPAELNGEVIIVQLKTDENGQCFLQVRNTAGGSPAGLLPLGLKAGGKENK